MLSVIIFAICIGLSSQQLPNTHELTQMIDAGFRMIDTDHDGILSLQELRVLASKEDLDNDGFVSLQEYAKYVNQTEAGAKPMFDALDTDGDGLLHSDHLIDYLHILDKNDNGEVDMHEYEHFQVQLIQCVYGEHGHGHGQHGHAAACFTGDL